MELPAVRCIAALCLASCTVGCHEVEPSVVEPQEFPVATPTEGATLTREWVGEIRAVRHVELRALHRGMIEALGVDEGEHVHRGQLLFTINARLLEQERLKAEAAVASATADVKAARVEATNTRMLFDNGVLSGPPLELAEANLEGLAARVRQAKAEAQHASERLSLARVVAPFDGVVNRLPHREGSLVLEEDLLTTITDASEVFVYFRVSEQDYLAHRSTPQADRPERVRLKLADGTLYPHAGAIDAVEGEFDKNTGSIGFRARFPNPEQLLKHGATGKIVVEREDSDAVVIPQSATFEIQEHIYVFTVDDDAVVHATRVMPSARIGADFVIESGLGPDDRIVIEGAQRLRDGAQIVPIMRNTPIARGDDP